jgi:hypothetical protein
MDWCSSLRCFKVESCWETFSTGVCWPYKKGLARHSNHGRIQLDLNPDIRVVPLIEVHWELPIAKIRYAQ